MSDLYTMHHTSLLVSDLDKSRRFYEEVLKMRQTQRPDLPFPGIWYQLGAQQIHLLALPSPDPTSGRPDHGGRDRHVALLVDDLDVIKAMLNEHQVPFTLSKSGRRALFCRDPDANAIEIIEKGQIVQ